MNESKTIYLEPNGFRLAFSDSNDEFLYVRRLYDERIIMSEGDMVAHIITSDDNTISFEIESNEEIISTLDNKTKKNEKIKYDTTEIDKFLNSLK